MVEMIKELKKIVAGFTKGLLSDGNNNSKCFVVCMPLSGYLSFAGYDAELVEGEVSGNHHYWIEIKNLVVDPTASQFKKPNGNRMPKIYIGKKPSWYEKLP